jgi:hypothetical protein
VVPISNTSGGVNLLTKAAWELYYNHSKSAEAYIHSQARKSNPNPVDKEIYLDHSPSGQYVQLSDTITISQEAYSLMVEERHKLIDGMIDRGESLSANGVTYEEYRLYACYRGTGDGSGYDFLCFEGKSRAYFEEQAVAVYEKWAEGADIPDEELREWGKYVTNYIRVWDLRRRLNENSGKLQDALAANGIELQKDEKLTIRLSSDFRLLVSGIEDEKKRQDVEMIINDTFKHSLFIYELSLPISEPDLDLYNAEAYLNASNMRHAMNFLNDNTDGVTLNDLHIDNKGTIYGNLPEEILDKLNSAVYKIDDNFLQAMTDEELFWYNNKLAIQSSLKWINEYGSDNFPTMSFYFEYADEKLHSVNGKLGKAEGRTDLYYVPPSRVSYEERNRLQIIAKAKYPAR